MSSSGTQTDTTPGFGTAAFESFLETRDEPDWITAQRRAAFACYQDSQQAELDPEEWKRVDLRRFQPEQYELCDPPADTTPQNLKAQLTHRTEFAGHVSHLDGHCVGQSLSDNLRRQGVLFGNLGCLLQEHAEVLRPHLLTRAVQPDKDRFASWHAAFWTSGTVLYVPREVEIREPLHSVIALAGNGATDLGHTLVILEEGSQATLLEETLSADPQTAGLHVGAVELLIGRGAHLRYVQLQNWNQQVFHFAHQAGCVAQNGQLQWTVAGLGAKLAHVHQDVTLEGPGARAEVNGVSFATERQLISFYTQQTHQAPETESDLLYKEVLRNRARVAWRGMIRVDPEAQRISGFQRNDALLLDSECRADAIPGLEIEADDVRCSHAATAGRVDEEQLFYCMSRGIHRREAMHMIVEGFFHDVYDRIPVEAVREALSTAVERKLGILN